MSFPLVLSGSDLLCWQTLCKAGGTTRQQEGDVLVETELSLGTPPSSQVLRSVEQVLCADRSCQQLLDTILTNFLLPQSCTQLFVL